MSGADVLVIPGGHILNVGIARLFWGRSVGAPERR